MSTIFRKRQLLDLVSEDFVEAAVLEDEELCFKALIFTFSSSANLKSDSATAFALAFSNFSNSDSVVLFTTSLADAAPSLFYFKALILTLSSSARIKFASATALAFSFSKFSINLAFSFFLSSSAAS